MYGGRVRIKFTATCHRTPRLCLLIFSPDSLLFFTFFIPYSCLAFLQAELFFRLGVLTPMFAPKNTNAIFSPNASTWQRTTFLMESKLE